MTTGSQGKTRCDNLNHGRAVVRVRHCPSCGDLLNNRISAGRCSMEQHATARRQRLAFCSDCGAQLITPN
jgi:hypothetical protein